ncbi:MAG: hypothetical protein KKG59_00990, partial [Nanoarchaeota archaeon]|nr:hypothetical protein [Nanoarchaeota archaeon]
NLAPKSRELILQINHEKIQTIADYARITSELRPFQNITITTNKNSEIYMLMVQPKYKVTVSNETELRNVTEQIINETSNETINITIEKEFPIIEKEIIGVEDIGFSVYPAPKNNIRMGLDLAGGTRVLLKPEEKTTTEELELAIENIKQRLNIFGLSDLVVRPTRDLSGQHYIAVEIAGINAEDIVNLLEKQGKFEARIGNETVFIGGKNDIPYVCLSGDCSGLDMRRPCGSNPDGSWFCSFRFSITISKDAAQRQADATRDLDVITENGQSYLTQSLDLYLDDELVDSLRVSSVFKGTALTDIEISGPGSGETEQAAMQNTLDNMKRLQTILKTGSLPVKLEIVKTDSISPVLGKKFTQNAIIVGLLAILTVAILIFIRYRDWKVSVPIVVTMLSEAIIILGIAAFIRWNLDLAAIAGIIVALGTGVDSQIVIADEILHGEGKGTTNWKEKLKSAFFIIMGAYVTTVVAMIPLFSAGAGLLKGFALTTIIGVSIGVFVTRPAYAKIVQILKEN